MLFFTVWVSTYSRDTGPSLLPHPVPSTHHIKSLGEELASVKCFTVYREPVTLISHTNPVSKALFNFISQRRKLRLREVKRHQSHPAGESWSPEENPPSRMPDPLLSLLLLQTFKSKCSYSLNTNLVAWKRNLSLDKVWPLAVFDPYYLWLCLSPKYTQTSTQRRTKMTLILKVCLSKWVAM